VLPVEMLQSTKLTYQAFDYYWSISPLTGALIRNVQHSPLEDRRKFPEKLHRALEYCAYPYKLDPMRFGVVSPSIDNFSETIARRTVGFMRSISSASFFWTRAYASLKKPIFRDSQTAFDYLNNFTDLVSDQDCLCRGFFVAKTSKSFSKSGILFFGAFLPTYQMHAWIIDDSQQPDSSDRDWINFTPLLALYETTAGERYR
jgi:hypothetical protein